MKRRRAQERDEAIAREQAEDRREHLLAELKAHQFPGGEPAAAPEAAKGPDANGAPPPPESGAE